jgi:transcriptional regulator with XRE-family HTH domain
MSDFFQRLHDAIGYSGLLQKEIAAKAGIKKRALDMYLGGRRSMPPADVAVSIASILGVTVEYLVTGKARGQTMDVSKYLEFHDVLDDLRVLSQSDRDLLKSMIKTAANRERRKTQMMLEQREC